MELNSVLTFLGGLALLVVGAECILRGASRVASMLGMQPMVIGLTVVSIGTSLPELAVAVTAVSNDEGPMVVGNIAGTNIVNILLILGLSAAIRPLGLRLLSIKLDVPVMIGAAIALFVMAMDDVLDRRDGLILLLSFVVYLFFLLKKSKGESRSIRKEYEEEYGTTALKIRKGWVAAVSYSLLLIVGMGITVLGADFLVEGAVTIARNLGVSTVIIGLTVVAIGTSAPELITTLVATFKDDRDVAIGNLIGSSITNILVILGVACAVSPKGLDVTDDILWLDLPLAAAVAIVCYPVFRSDQMVSRREGIVFVVLYAAYLFSLIFLRA